MIIRDEVELSMWCLSRDVYISDESVDEEYSDLRSSDTLLFNVIMYLNLSAY